MPTDFARLDAKFPDFEKGSTEQRFARIQSYLFMLQEQLRYALANLDTDNFNETGLTELGRLITEPLTIAVENGTDGTSTVVKLCAGEAELSSGEIRLTGLVSFQDLKKEGKTTINGANITTGTIKAIHISGCEIEGSVFRTLLRADGTGSGQIDFLYGDSWATENIVATLKMDDNGANTDSETKYRLILETGGAWLNPAIKLKSAAGISLAADKSIYIWATEKATLRGTASAQIEAPDIYLVGNVYINGALTYQKS